MAVYEPDIPETTPGYRAPYGPEERQRAKHIEDEWLSMDRLRLIWAQYMFRPNALRGAQRHLALSRGSLLGAPTSLLGSGDAGRKSLLGE